MSAGGSDVMSIEARIAAYLDGELDARAAAEVEAALFDPAVAQLLSEELMLRQLLASMPPEAPPQALVARLEEALGVGDGLTDHMGRQLRRVLPVWGLRSRSRSRSPALGATAVAAARASVTGARLAVAGFATASTVGHSLGVLADLAVPGLGSSASKPKSLWRRAAAYLWQRRK